MAKRDATISSSDQKFVMKTMSYESGIIRVQATQWLAFVDTLVILGAMFGVRILDTIITCVAYPEVRGVLAFVLPLIFWAVYSIYADFRWLLRRSARDEGIPAGLILRLAASILLAILYFPLMLVLWDPNSWIGA